MVVAAFRRDPDVFGRALLRLGPGRARSRPQWRAPRWRLACSAPARWIRPTSIGAGSPVMPSVAGSSAAGISAASAFSSSGGSGSLCCTASRSRPRWRSAPRRRWRPPPPPRLRRCSSSSSAARWSRSSCVDQGLPVGDRDLVVVGMDFREGQEAVPVAAVIDEGRLQRRFDPRDFGEVDITAKLFAVGAFEVEFLDAVAAHDDHPGFLRMGRVDEHFVGHWMISLRRTRPSARAARRPRGEAGRSGPDRCGGRGSRGDAGLRRVPMAKRAVTMVSRERGTLKCLCCVIGSVNIATRISMRPRLRRRRPSFVNRLRSNSRTAFEGRRLIPGVLHKGFGLTAARSATSSRGRSLG